MRPNPHLVETVWGCRRILPALAWKLRKRGGGDMSRLLFRCVKLLLFGALLFGGGQIARAEMASVYGGGDGLCGSRTANGEHLNCSAMTAAHRTLPFRDACSSLSQWLRGCADQ